MWTKVGLWRNFITGRRLVWEIHQMADEAFVEKTAIWSNTICGLLCSVINYRKHRWSWVSVCWRKTSDMLVTDLCHRLLRQEWVLTPDPFRRHSARILVWMLSLREVFHFNAIMMFSFSWEYSFWFLSPLLVMASKQKTKYLYSKYQALSSVTWN